MVNRMATTNTPKIPVTVLTGFLGSGKTTLLNRILQESHGLRIAVIENEFGEVGVDQDLVINAEEEIFEMNNGCICCTVRGDLIRILGNLVHRRHKFDRVIVETTGMADPGPVAQTFFVDDEISSQFTLDGIITLVDARHIELHLDDSAEALAQIAFADVLLLNKIDLVSSIQLTAVENRLRGINAVARLQKVHMAKAALNDVLDVGGFDLQRALDHRASFLEPEYPFEWAGIYQLQAGSHRLQLTAGPDPSLGVYLLPVTTLSEDLLKQHAEAVFREFSDWPHVVAPDQPLTLLRYQELTLDSGNDFIFPLTLAHNHCQRWQAQRYVALYTQHLPEEFQLQLVSDTGTELLPLVEHAFNAAHSHDDTVSSVALEFAGDLDAAVFMVVLRTLLQSQGQDLFRSKGIVSIAGDERRYIFQGVHMLLDEASGKPWGAEPRCNRLVFIGRHLQAASLEKMFKSCVV
jgi:G3E family GTPase